MADQHLLVPRPLAGSGHPDRGRGGICWRGCWLGAGEALPRFSAIRIRPPRRPRFAVPYVES